MFYGDSLSHRCFSCECDSNSDSIRGSSCQQSPRLLSETLEDFHLLVSKFTWSLEGEPCWVISHDSIMHVNIMWAMNSYLLLPPGEILPYKGSGAQFQELKWYKLTSFSLWRLSVCSADMLCGSDSLDHIYRVVGRNVRGLTLGCESKPKKWTNLCTWGEMWSVMWSDR